MQNCVPFMIACTCRTTKIEDKKSMKILQNMVKYTIFAL